jgi:hypothetical protein
MQMSTVQHEWLNFEHGAAWAWSTDCGYKLNMRHKLMVVKSVRHQ